MNFETMISRLDRVETDTEDITTSIDTLSEAAAETLMSLSEYASKKNHKAYMEMIRGIESRQDDIANKIEAVFEIEDENAEYYGGYKDVLAGFEEEKENMEGMNV